jgi:hypothetical protein
VRARNQCRTGRADRNNERSNAPAGDRSEIFASFRGGFEVLDETNDRAIDFASSRSIPRDERNPTLTAMATSMFIQFTKVEVLFLATSVAHRKRSAIPRPLPRAHPHVTMSFAVSASATRVVASARAPVKARNTTVAAFAAPVASKASAAKLAARHATAGVALRATGASTVARAGSSAIATAIFCPADFGRERLATERSERDGAKTHEERFSQRLLVCFSVTDDARACFLFLRVARRKPFR